MRLSGDGVVRGQENATASQRAEEKIRERCRVVCESARRRETALLAELRRVTAERQIAIDAELERTKYNITR